MAARATAGTSGRISRRRFLALSGVAAAAAATTFSQSGLAFFEAAPDIPNPLRDYPDRGWEKIYRDQYAYDSTFTFVCAPNDTHMCRLRAFARNGVVIRTEQNYDAGTYRDPQGNSSSVAWNPRGCLKGYTVARRLYGPYRLKYPLVRAGWKATTSSCVSAGTRSIATSRVR